MLEIISLVREALSVQARYYSNTMKKSVLIICSAVLLSTVTGCHGNSSWVEPLDAAHASVDLNWVSSADFTAVSPADMRVAEGLPKNASVVVMSGEELQKKMPRTLVNTDAGTNYLLVRAISDLRNSPNSIAFGGDIVYSVLTPLGGCRDLRNSAVIVKATRTARTAKVLCAPTI